MTSKTEEGGNSVTVAREIGISQSNYIYGSMYVYYFVL